VKPVDFSLHQPATVDAAVALLAVHGDDGKVLAGGQSLVPLLNFRLARPDHVIDIGRVAGLGELRPGPGELVVGAMVRQSMAESSAAVAARCPLLAAALPNVAHPPIRARGTVGGSLAHADPAAELPAVAAALDATFEAVSVRGRRKIAASDFFRTFLTTALEPDELLLSVRFPAVPPGTGAAFREVSRRRGDFAIAGAAAQVTLSDGAITDCRICLTGVADIPFRCHGPERVLLGTRADPATLVRAAAAALDILDPPGDLHAPAAYRKHVAGVLLRRAVAEAFQRAAASRDGQGGHGGREGLGE
jgi:aerobic carbon-monoxide dehydrogenase medium subunit